MGLEKENDKKNTRVAVVHGAVVAVAKTIVKETQVRLKRERERERERRCWDGVPLVRLFAPKYTQLKHCEALALPLPTNNCNITRYSRVLLIVGESTLLF